MILIDGRKIKEKILASLKSEISALPFQPVFCDILIGQDPSSLQYVKMKWDAAESIGIRFLNASFSATTSTEDLIKEIEELNNIENMSGIIIQLPVPASVDKRAILDAISPSLDVDCLGKIASENFYSGKGTLAFPTALACLEVLDSANLDLKDKKIVVLGQGELVGKPTTALLRFRGFSPETVSTETKNKEEIIKNADVIISGIGRAKYIKGDMLKKGVVIIDAGTSEANGSISGDVDFDSVKDVAGAISPVPGGVGPVTVAMLLKNVLEVARGLK